MDVFARSRVVGMARRQSSKIRVLVVFGLMALELSAVEAVPESPASPASGVASVEAVASLGSSAWGLPSHEWIQWYHHDTLWLCHVVSR